jgi:uncharacterized protein YifN (PemK superfamily)
MALSITTAINGISYIHCNNRPKQQRIDSCNKSSFQTTAYFLSEIPACMEDYPAHVGVLQSMMSNTNLDCVHHRTVHCPVPSGQEEYLCKNAVH